MILQKIMQKNNNFANYTEYVVDNISRKFSAFLFIYKYPITISLLMFEQIPFSFSI